jgi:hypothetical protein
MRQTNEHIAKHCSTHLDAAAAGCAAGGGRTWPGAASAPDTIFCRVQLESSRAAQQNKWAAALANYPTLHLLWRTPGQRCRAAPAREVFELGRTLLSPSSPDAAILRLMGNSSIHHRVVALPLLKFKYIK